LILKESIRINRDDRFDPDVSIDTTVHDLSRQSRGKNITYPTDNKLHRKIITKCKGIAEKEDLPVRQSYSRTLKKLSVDRGYKGVSKINEVIIQSPKPFNDKTQTKYKQKKLKEQFGRRAAIEPVIRHLKSDRRMKRNYYKGITGDSINVMLSAVAYNFKRMMRKWSSSFWLFFYSYYISPIISFFDQIIYPQEDNWVFKG